MGIPGIFNFSKIACLGVASHLYLDTVSDEKNYLTQAFQALPEEVPQHPERSWSLITQVAVGSVVGLCMAQMTFFLERAFFGATLTAAPMLGVVFSVLVAIVLPVMEELTFRGYLDLQLQGYSAVPRIVSVAGLFALTHYRSGLVAFCLTKAFVLGLVLGGVREEAGLSASIVAHSVHNIMVELL